MVATMPARATSSAVSCCAVACGDWASEAHSKGDGGRGGAAQQQPSRPHLSRLRQLRTQLLGAVVVAERFSSCCKLRRGPGLHVHRRACEVPHVRGMVWW